MSRIVVVSVSVVIAVVFCHVADIRRRDEPLLSVRVSRHKPALKRHRVQHVKDLALAEAELDIELACERGNAHG